MNSSYSNIHDETELLSLKERILLMQNHEKGNNVETISTPPILKRVHSISDSEESDCGVNNLDDEFELPSLGNLPFTYKVNGVLLLSDSEDEAKEMCIVSNSEQNVFKNSPFKNKVNEVLLLSDSEDEAKKMCIVSNSEQNVFRNSPLKNKVNEVLLLSDSEDEAKEMCIVSNSEQNVFEDACHIEHPEKKFDARRNAEQMPKTSKRSKISTSKSVKDSDKEIAKQQKLQLREEKKREQELAKAIRQSEKEIQKSKKPDESLKAMKAIIDHNLILESGSQDIFCSFDEGNVKYSIEENPINFSVAWCKTVINVTVENNQILKEEHDEFENDMIVLIPNESFIKMVHAYMQTSKGKSTNETVLSDYIVNITSVFPQMKITCVILNVDKYIRTIKDSETHGIEFKKIAKQVSKAAIEEAIIEVQLQAAVNFIFVNSMRELGDLIFRFTKAIAEAPMKKEKQMQKDLAFSWYADADTNCPVKLTKERISFVKLWQQQLKQFQNVSQETAEAIAALYSSPESLMKAYKQCSSRSQAEKLLQDIVVRRNYGPLGTQRRIGPELSYKIHLFFTSPDGNQILQR